jgi:hypothetical protein
MCVQPLQHLLLHASNCIFKAVKFNMPYKLWVCMSVPANLAWGRPCAASQQAEA